MTPEKCSKSVILIKNDPLWGCRSIEGYGGKGIVAHPLPTLKNQKKTMLAKRVPAPPPARAGGPAPQEEEKEGKYEY